MLAKQSNSEICFHIVGDGSALESLKLLVQEKQIPDVQFWGRFSENEMHVFFEKTDFLIISLKPDDVYERYIPSKFQTYLDIGKPILCAMNGTVAQSVKDNNIGIVTDPRGIEQIGNAFNNLTKLTDIEKAKIKETSQEMLNTYYNRERNLNRLTEIIKETSTL